MIRGALAAKIVAAKVLVSNLTENITYYLLTKNWHLRCVEGIDSCIIAFNNIT